MNWFKQEFSKSNIISGTLSLGVWGAIIYLAIVGADIPDILYFGGSAIIGFFFGSRRGQAEVQALVSQRGTDAESEAENGKV